MTINTHADKVNQQFNQMGSNFISLQDRLTDSLALNPVFNNMLIGVVDEFKRRNPQFKSLKDIKKFIRDSEEQKNHGIFLSQHSGISSKQNYQIDIRGKNILIYVHHVDYNPEKIKIAIDIIDSLHEKVAEMHENSGLLDGFCISKEIMDDINSEYTDFVGRKIAMINMMKDFQKRMLGELDAIKFPCLSKCLSDKYGGVINDSNETIKCNICNNFEAKNNRALASHQRNCKKKHVQKSSDAQKEINIETS